MIDNSVQPNQTKINVLYVDDESDLLLVGKLFLERLGGFRVDTLTSAQKALESSPLDSYDAIVSDYEMPRMNGIGFLKEVRERFGDIPFILFTGRGREEVVIEAINNGADFYIQKGGDPQSQFAELSHKIRQAVRRRQVEEDLRTHLDKLTHLNDDLKASEQKFRTIIDTSPDMIWETDGYGTIEYVSHRCADITGYSPEELVGTSILSHLPQDDVESMRTHIEHDFSREPGLISFDITAIHKDGSHRVLNVRSFIRFDSAGNRIGFRGVATDITDRSNYLKNLHDSEARLRSFIETTQDAVSLFDEEGKVLEWNVGSELIFGIPKENVIGRYVWDVTFDILPHEQRTEDKRNTLKHIFRTSLQTGIPPPYDSQIIKTERLDGKRIFIRQTTFPIKTTNGFRFGSMARDITEEKRIQEALSESEERYRRMAERSSDLILLLDNKLGVTYASPSSRSILGYEPEELIGKTHEFAYANIFSPGDSDTSYDAQMVLKGECNQKSVFNKEVKITKKDGNVAYVSIHAVPTYRDGILTGAQATLRDITERKIAEIALKESEEKYRLLTEMINDIIYMVDTSGTITHISPQISRYGYTPEEIISRPITDFIYKEDLPDVIADLEKTLSTREPTITLFQIVDKQGNLHWVEDNGAVVVYTTGKVTGISGILRDVTERKKLEEAFSESEDKYRRLTENAQDMIYRMSIPDRRFEYVNPASAVLTGYTPEEFYDDPDIIQRLIAPSWQAHFSEKREEFLNQKFTLNSEFQIIDRAGNIRWVDHRKTLVTAINETIVAQEGIITDITRLKNIEYKLRSNEWRFLAATLNNRIAIWEVNEQGIITFISQAIEDILGFKPDEIVGKAQFFAFFNSDEKDKLKADAMEIARSHESFHDFICPYTHRNGTAVIVLTSGTPIFSEDGSFSGYCGIFMDITKEKEAERKIIESEARSRKLSRQLNLLTGITRHDILNKISVIKGSMALLEMELSQSQVSEYLELINRSIGKIQSEIEFTRIFEDLGQDPIWVCPDTLLPKESVPDSVTFSEDLRDISIYADPMLEKVFFNLLDNSLRHGQRVTDIHVSAYKADSNLVIVWEDNGAGIPSAEKEQIFERGFGMNTGLGLFLVREILSLTGISIRETGEEGKGARFEIIVPEGGYRFI